MKKLLLTLILLLPNLGAAQAITLPVLPGPGAAPVTLERKIVLTTANTVTFRGEVNGESTAKAMLELIDLNKVRGNSNYPIYLVLDSPGGSVPNGQDFIDFAVTIPNVHTISLFSASMASAIMQAIPGKRYVTKSSIVIFHRAKGRFQGQFEEGEVESQLNLWKKIIRNIEQVNASRIGIPLLDYKAKVANEWRLHGYDNLDQKVADEMVSISCSPQLIDKHEVVKMMSIFFSMKLEYSACPLIRVPLSSKGGDDV